MLNKITLFVFLFTIILQSQSIIINEIVSSNSSLLDEDETTQDWIEIYNPEDTLINLHNYYFTDDIGQLKKWRFPDINLLGNSYLILFASGKDRYSENLHLNFKLTSEGERIIVSNEMMEIIDQVETVSMPAGFSLGRNNQLLSDWMFYTTPTPGYQNSDIAYAAFSHEPIFNHEGGFYSDEIIISFADTSDIYYTLNGSEPDRTSFRYKIPLIISETTVIRAKTIIDSLLPSRTITNTYFINEKPSLPIVSLSTNPDNFFNDEIGIYVTGTNGSLGYCSDLPQNWNRDWERPIHIEYFDANYDLGFSIDAGVKIHGGCTRIFPQKSLQINTRSKYGFNKIPFNIFSDLNYSSYNSIILRNSGNDIKKTFFRDALIHQIAKKLDMETLAYQPTIMFLNGKYWGIHNLRERPNKEYLALHHEVDPDNIDLLKDKSTVIEGDNLNYKEMINFIRNNSMSIQQNYEHINTKIDIDNYISYILTEMYCANTDWYHENTKFWRPRTEDGKWRWILFDTDLGFGCYNIDNFNINMLEIVSDVDRYPAVIFNGLIESEEFKNQFINSFADYSNSIFRSDKVVSIIDSLESLISNEMPRHIDKWGISGSTFEAWQGNIDDLRFFANNRIESMRNHFIEYFDLEGLVNIKLDVQNIQGGNISINSLSLNSFPWNGTYFKSLPLLLKASPKAEYSFSYWQINDSIVNPNPELIINPEDNISLMAIFTKDSSGLGRVVINEINYNSRDDLDVKDWVEISNISEEEINLSNWRFKDSKEDNAFILPDNTILHSGEQLVLCRDTIQFNYFFPNVYNKIGNFDFNLSNNGETLFLYNSSYYLIDSLTYLTNSPWPSKPDGKGETLELDNPYLDNSNNSSWSSSKLNGGTPGSTNSKLIIDSLFINEFLVINDSISLAESDGYYSWIELFNKSISKIDFKNIFITDDYSSPGSSKIKSDLNIAGRNSIILSKGNTSNGYLDLELKDRDGQIGLYLINNVDTTLIDSITYGQQFSNISYGRFPMVIKGGLTLIIPHLRI